MAVSLLPSCVSRCGAWRGTWLVRSESTAEYCYYVQLDARRATCDCPDFLRHGADGYRGYACKHIITVLRGTCDWTGDAWADACPECGAPTYSARRAA